MSSNKWLSYIVNVLVYELPKSKLKYLFLQLCRQLHMLYSEDMAYISVDWDNRNNYNSDIKSLLAFLKDKTEILMIQKFIKIVDEKHHMGIAWYVMQVVWSLIISSNRMFLIINIFLKN